MQFLRNNWWKVLLGFIAAIVVLMFALGMAKKNNSKRTTLQITGPNIPKSTDTTESKQLSGIAVKSLADCGAKNDYFVNFPLREGDYGGITPLGNLNPIGHTFPTDHLYVWVKGDDPNENTKDPQALKVGKPLLAPANIIITEVDGSEETGGVTDYGVHFAVCKELSGEFGHVGTLSLKVKDAIAKLNTQCNEYDTGGNHYRHCQYRDLNIKVSAGEPIGTAGDGRSHFLDIWTTDTRLSKIQYANPARWRSDSFYVACFLDYFDAVKKERLYTMLGDQELNNKRTKEPRCGTVVADIAGTAQGIWFYNLQGPVQQEDEHLALAWGNMETDKQFFSVGTAGKNGGIESGAYQFLPKTEGQIDRDFSQVSADGNVYCYDTININQQDAKKAILLTMPSTKNIRLKSAPTASCGTGPWTLGDEYVEYER